MMTNVWAHFDSQAREIFGKNEFFCSPFTIKGLLPEQEKHMHLRIYTSSKEMVTHIIPWERSFDLYAKTKQIELPEAYISEMRIAPGVGEEIVQMQTYIIPVAIPSMMSGGAKITPYNKDTVHSTGHVIHRIEDDHSKSKRIHYDTASEGYLRVTALRNPDDEIRLPISDEESENWNTIRLIADALENHIAKTEFAKKDIYVGWSFKPTYTEMTFHEPDVKELESKKLDEMLAKLLRHHGTAYMAKFLSHISSAK